MIWLETARTDARATEQLATFASQLAGLGLRVGIDPRGLPDGLNRTVRFDVAPYLCDDPVAAEDRVALIAADALTDVQLVELRRLAGSGPRPAVAFGRFASRQKLIATQARLSFLLGVDPRMVNLAERGLGPDLSADGPVFGVRRTVAPREGRPRLLAVLPALDPAEHVADLSTLALARGLELAVLTDGETKQAWVRAHGPGLAVYNYGELLPRDLAQATDLLLCTAPIGSNYRLQCLVANVAAAGGALLDGSPGHVVAREIDAFLRVPARLGALPPFLEAEVLPNLGEIGDHVARSALAHATSGERVAALFGASGPAPARRPERRDAGPPRAGAIVFMPTNGIGLGHAQRCTLIAAELDRDRVEPVFAAFPSCTGLVRSYGFDVMPLIQRSPLHARPFENDIANYVRLRALTAGRSALVFDGGFVFDSVFRSIVENHLTGIWIRRGLWQSHQDNSLALDRAKVFARVIVPTEAFDELNEPREWGGNVHPVGPVVQRPRLDAAARHRLREDLAERFGMAFERLVVTQLGGGVAADRNAQIQAICGMMERREDVLHLVLAWPTAVLQPGWHGWRRSRVVRTRHAAVLAAAADLCVSAAGYNSFHEIVYGAVPAILIPQTGAGMDDQTARARAARDRDLAGLVAPHELMTLDRTVLRYLDAGEGAAASRRLQALVLPEPGNRSAAALIEEFTVGRDALEQPAQPDHSAGRR